MLASAITTTRVERAGVHVVATIEWHDHRRDLMFHPLVSPQGAQAPKSDPDRLVKAFVAELDALRSAAPALVTV